MKSDKLEGSGRGKLASEPPPFLPELEELLVLAGVELLGTESTPPFPDTEVLPETLGREAVPPFAEAVDTDRSASTPNTTKQIGRAHV